ncbi:MAG: glycosyltransferase family 39 protein [Chloroflexota bacterium]|nr:glycosyltransferase family 39 protein [Chloroflexota bacterium]
MGSLERTSLRENRSALTVAALRQAQDTAARMLPYLLVLIAFALRIHRIDYQSIWRDEGVSLHLAASSIPAILADRAGDVHPPLYFILLRFWTQFAGFSELSVRFFSLIFGVLLVPSVYFIVRKIFGTKTALAATAIAAFSPLYVVYSQEARMYSMLPLFYLLVIYKLYQLAQGERLKWGQWIELAALEVLGLHLHYFSILAVIYMNLFLAVLWLRRRGGSLRRWLSSQVLVALSYAPWAWMVVECWMTAGPPKSYFGGFAPQRGINTFEVASIVWYFSNGGYDLRGHRLFVALSSLLAVAFVIALPFALRADARRRQILITLCHWMVPLSMAFVFWWWKPRVSPRYVIMFTVPFFVLLGRAIVVSIETRGPAKLTGVCLALTLMATFTLGLGIAYFAPGYSKDNVRGMVEYLEPLSSADDLIIVHPLDYSVGYYYTGDASIMMIDPDEAQGMASLEEAMRGGRRAFLAWPFGTLAGGRGLSPFLLEMSGRLVGRELFRGYSLRIYQLERAVSFPEVQPISADFGDVRLTGAFYQNGVEADNAICVALRWRLARATKRAYKAAVILWDEAGHRLSSADVLLLNEQIRSTYYWAPGEEAINYYVVPVPIGTPPLSYRITVGVYDAETLEGLDILDEAGNPAGKDFFLGEVKLTKARDFEHDPYGTREGLHLETLDEPEVAGGLALEGFAVSGTPARTLSVTLRWRALRDGLPRYIPRLRLRQDDAILTEVGSSLFEERYPTTKWSRGEVVFEQRDLIYPPKAGRAVLEVEVDGRAIRLEEVELKEAELLFEASPMQHEVEARFGDLAQLIGYDLDQTEITAKDKVRLTLYWQAVNEEPIAKSYKVFTHLLSEEGRLIGQHDGFPASGTRPTTSWVEGEIIVDVHEMEFKETYQGEAAIEVGMYDPKTGERLSAFDSEGKRLPNDRVLLETVVTVK